MKRADEGFCKVQFDTFIKQFFSQQDVIWEDVAQQNEPPDYYLLLGTRKFAVEMTALMELISVGTSKPLPLFIIHRFLNQFVAKVGKIAKKKGYLQGDYLVTFPTPIDNFSDVQDRILDKLLEYIQRTSGMEMAPQETIFKNVIPKQMPQQCLIEKLRGKPNRVIGGGPILTKFEGEAAEDICDLLNESLNIKADKLKDIVEPTILVLLDEYRFGDQQMYKNCIPHLLSLDYFHTVFIVQDHNCGFPIHSQNHDWLKQ